MSIADLLYTGRAMKAEEGERWGWYNSITDDPYGAASTTAQRMAAGPNFAHGITKTMLHQEWNMSVDQAIEAEAQAQAICMQTRDFERAYNAFVNKQTPDFQGD